MDNQGNVVTTPQHWRRLQIRIALLFSLVLLLVVFVPLLVEVVQLVQT